MIETNREKQCFSYARTWNPDCTSLQGAKMKVGDRITTWKHLFRRSSIHSYRTTPISHITWVKDLRCRTAILHCHAFYPLAEERRTRGSRYTTLQIFMMIPVGSPHVFWPIILCRQTAFLRRCLFMLAKKLRVLSIGSSDAEMLSWYGVPQTRLYGVTPPNVRYSRSWDHRFWC